MTDELELRRYDAAGVDAIYDELVHLYAEAHEHLTGDPFYSTPHFEAALVKQRVHDGFELVAARLHRRLVGVSYGFTELEGAQFGFCELMVSPQYQRRGIAKRLHDELLRLRPEPRAALYVRKDNTPAQAAYQKWGWTKLRDVQPSGDAPNFDELVLIPKSDGFHADIHDSSDDSQD